MRCKGDIIMKIVLEQGVRDYIMGKAEKSVTIDLVERRSKL